MKLKVSGYSLLEVFMVTTFLLVFLVVINPALYVERFSQMLVKMNVLNESNLMTNKLMMQSFSSCESVLTQSDRFDFLLSGRPLSLFFNSGGLFLKNQQTNASVLLYRHLSLNDSEGFVYYDHHNELSVGSEVYFIDFNYGSSILNYATRISFNCLSNQIELGAY
ncbi:MAG: hypothetical protein ACON35_05600 [Candidatus Marinamargulisbacteria bacterium]